MSLHAFSDKGADGTSGIDVWKCSYCLGGIIFVKLANTLMNANLYFFMDNLIGVKVVYIIRCFLLDKALKKPIARDKEFSIGEISNMNNSDISKISYLAFDSITMFLLPFEIIVGFTILGFMVGYAILPTTGLLMIAAFSTRFFVIISMRLQKTKQRQGDKLSKTIWGCYGNIRFIKLECLENFFFRINFSHFV